MTQTRNRANRLEVLLSDEEAEAVKTYAEREGISRSDVARMAIRAMLNVARPKKHRAPERTKGDTE